MAAGRRSEVYRDILCGGGSIINGNGRQIHIWDTKISFKDNIEAAINRTVVVLQCLNSFFHVSLCKTMTVQELPICITHIQFHCSCESKISTLFCPIFHQRYIRLPYYMLVFYCITVISIPSQQVSTKNRANRNIRKNVREMR